MNQGPLVSVVMNCFNGERFLKEAIDSVYAQTWPRWEIVFWDNASTDGTAAIARQYDERLRYFRAERNTRLGEARNLAFRQTRGEYIAMLDCDDVWFPNTLQRLVNGIENDGQYAVCYGAVDFIDAAGQILRKFGPEERRGNILGALLRHFDIMPSASLTRRSILEKSGHTFDVALSTSEDYCFFISLAADYPFHCLAESVAQYRVHDGALTNKTMAKWADEWEYTLTKVRASHPGLEAAERGAFRHALARVDYYRARNLMRIGDRASARQLLRRNWTVDLRYFGLFLVSLLPPMAWDTLHEWYTKRSQFT